MKVHEFQAKALMAQYRVPVPLGFVATTPKEAGEFTRNLGGRAVVKAQVHAGGRGKAGGVRLVSSPQEAEKVTASLLGRPLRTAQTGPEGVPVSRVLVEETVPVARELYLALAVDGSAGGVVAIASEAGGVDIEEVAAATPEKVLREGVDIAIGLQPFQARRMAFAMGLEGNQVRLFAEVALNLYRLLVDKDASLLEINPLVLTTDGRLVALDAKATFEDDALFRHPELREMRDPSQEDPLEARAREFGISYVRLEGNVGCLVNGAGLAMATMDMVRSAGADPANFLDVGGTADEERVKQAFTIILEDARVKGALVNVFGGILRCDLVARGVVAACREKGATDFPIVARLLGTNMEEGRQILTGAGLRVTTVETLGEAAQALRRVIGG